MLCNAAQSYNYENEGRTLGFYFNTVNIIDTFVGI